MAGMLAAAAVSPFVDEVVLLDKETSLGRSGSEGELHEAGSLQILPKRI